MPLDRPLPDDTREALKMLWSVTEEQLIDINRHRDSLHKIWHVAPVKPREGLLVYADGTDWNPGSGAGYYEYVGGVWRALALTGSGGGGGGYTIVQDEGVALTVRTTLNFVGAGVTATDDGTRTVVTISGGGAGAVSSVFTRTGAVVAVTGDYTAAQVTNAVSTLGSYANPTWITSLAYAKLTGVPTTFTPAAHVHAAADTTSGVFAVARLGTGTPSSSNYLRGDGTWATVATGSAQTPWLSNINAAGFRLDNAGGVGIGKIPTFPLDVIGDCHITGVYYVNGVPLVTSVFGRPGAVVAATGDYTAAQVTNAVSTLGSYADPSWITSLAYAKITGAPTISAIQTPWLQNIAAAGFNLSNVGLLGVGVTAPLAPLSVNKTVTDVAAANQQISIGEPSNNASYRLTAGYGSAAGVAVNVGNIQAWHGAVGSPLLLNPNGGNVGIGTVNPTSRLSVVGLPTSSAGLTTGDIWIDTAAGRVLKIV